MFTLEQLARSYRSHVFRETKALVKTTDFEALWHLTLESNVRLPKSHVYIYGLADPRIRLIRYIGRTAGTLAVRLSQHILQAKRCNSYKDQWIRVLLERGYEPKVVPICTVPVAKADAIEKLIMKRFDYEVGPLVNDELLKLHIREKRIKLWGKYINYTRPPHPEHRRRKQKLDRAMANWLKDVLSGKAVTRNLKPKTSE